MSIDEARKILEEVKGKRLSISDRVSKALELAKLILEESHKIQTSEEREQQEELNRMLQDTDGRYFTTNMTDQCFRTDRNRRVANQLNYLLEKYGIPKYLSQNKQRSFKFFKSLGNSLGSLLVPFVKREIRKQTARVILPGEERAFKKFTAQRRKEGVRININHLGEAILGEKEAKQRLETYLEDLAKPEVEYISVKISTIFSQINLLDWDKTLETLATRLKTLYRAASKHQFKLPTGEKIPKFVNLDMEEYRDLYLTVSLFRHVLDEPEFFNCSAGIVLQSYVPDSYLIQQDLTIWALQRVAKGGAPIKIRIVKGANLAMEKVDASLHGWPQAPYSNKQDVDANFKKMVTYGCEPERARAVNLGIGSHNIFDIAWALILRSERSIEDYVIMEMLEGMADPTRRVVQKLSGQVMMYCPVATRQEFQNAVAYLLRRLDENTGPQNFLRYAFNLHPGTQDWLNLANGFMDSCQKMNAVSTMPSRYQNRMEPPLRPNSDCCFFNEPDTDWTQVYNRSWGQNILDEWSKKEIPPIPVVIGLEHILKERSEGAAYDPSYPDKLLYKYTQANIEDVDRALITAEKSQKRWKETTFKERSILLAEVAQRLRRQRANLIGSMVADTGKTVYEADIEVSEAIDFVEYYRRNAEEVGMLQDIQWKPKGTVVVAPPWNFPCSISVGGIAAALAAGNCVIFKPATEAILAGWTLIQTFWDAGISPEILQFLPCEDEPVGSQLIKDPRVAAIVLTGSTETAKLFFKMRPGLDLLAETGGKNAIIVTSLADRDLAIKDIIQSAFGHAGQKCSACSLLILEAELYDDKKFMSNLCDATASLKVGSPWDPQTKVPPLIRTPGEALTKGLTELEEGEEWLLQPKQDSENPNLWSPGIKIGVKENSFSYKTELFGPVLSVLRADNLDHALKLANGTPYGLTSGIQTLDERERLHWVEEIEAGNLYINRGITGAIVQRQPFGGCKASSFGPGAKAGGPNYVMQLMNALQNSLPKEKEALPKVLRELEEFAADLDWNSQEQDLWKASLGSYAFYYKHYFRKKHDPSQILGQDNFQSYKPRKQMVLRVQKEDKPIDVLRTIASALVCGVPLEISVDEGRRVLDFKNIKCIRENESEFCNRISKDKVTHIRLLSPCSNALRDAMANGAVNVHRGPVLANGRIELLHMLQEVSISFDYHRYGYLGERETEKRSPLKPSKQEEMTANGRCCCMNKE